ncbi:excinuclease ABC subunit UvrC [Luteimonas sp. SDU101]|uniref:excinuclease ABC subunit UvrC n=1 Tax=unclassified Luteimonas TaxID=2629088 RepID=UPI003EB94C2E
MTGEQAPVPRSGSPPDDVPFDGKAFARGLSTAPGVYRMIAADGSVLYVGKAGALRKRVASYFANTPKASRTIAMLAQVARMEVTVTRTEGEALLLENQLIKSLRPRYNVLLRDDKSYPYVLVTQEPWPRLALHRGPRSLPGRYFGPYPGVTAVRETLNMMHKLFKLRSCEDSVFRNRSRPCLQHQIGRCTAPCVGLVPAREYADAVRRATLFLEGRSDELTRELGEAMEAASARLDFEEAARLRDLVASVRTLQARQYVDGRAAELDVLAVAMQGSQACVLLLAFRDGRNLGTRAFFPRTNGSDNPAEVLAAFVSQYYGEQPAPREIVLDRAIEDIPLLEEAFTAATGRKVQIRHSVRSERAGYLDLARRNAELSLATELGSRAAQQARIDSLCALLGLSQAPARIECFDISHTMGEATVASCVVFDAEGAVRSQYRRYNIAGIEPGDDYAAMQQALTRRFRRAVEPRETAGSATAGEPVDVQDAGGGPQALEDDAPQSPREPRPAGILPDLLLIDGGAGQVAQARGVLDALGIATAAGPGDAGVIIVGVAKGEERRAGHERLLLPDGRELRPGADSPGLQLIQQVRDEAHRFAITGHRGRRQKARSHSRLEDIPGIGPRRRASLLKHFGGLGGLKAAGIEEIARVEGVNAALAARIYATLHGLQDAVPPGTPPSSK